jgi:hypothetical protein
MRNLNSLDYSSDQSLIRVDVGTGCSPMPQKDQLTDEENSAEEAD